MCLISSCATGNGLFAARAASSSVGHMSRRRQGFQSYRRLGTHRGGDLLLDSGCWISPGSRNLFMGHLFHATAFSLLTPCRLAEDTFCSTMRVSRHRRLGLCRGSELMTRSRPWIGPGGRRLFEGRQLLFRRGSELPNKRHGVLTVLSVAAGIAVRGGTNKKFRFF